MSLSSPGACERLGRAGPQNTDPPHGVGRESFSQSQADPLLNLEPTFPGNWQCLSRVTLESRVPRGRDTLWLYLSRSRRPCQERLLASPVNLCFGCINKSHARFLYWELSSELV